jgi:hypothetical protein
VFLYAFRRDMLHESAVEFGPTRNQADVTGIPFIAGTRVGNIEQTYFHCDTNSDTDRETTGVTRG